MLIDAHELADGQAIAGDVVIIGGGPAGIAAARRLAQGGHRVVLLESGGTEIEPESQGLYAGRSVGLPYVDLDVTRLRLLGGSTNHWGNQISDFEPIDFARRDWVPYSGWPVTRAELQPYYEQAFSFLDLGTYDLDRPELWTRQGAAFQLPDFTGRKIRSKLFRVRTPPLLVGEHYLGELTASPTIRLYLHLNATSLNLDAGGNAVRSVSAATLDGKRVVATGTHYILACGGLENPRLLLVSNQVRLACGGLENPRLLLVSNQVRLACGGLENPRLLLVSNQVRLACGGLENPRLLLVSNQVRLACGGLENPRLLLVSNQVRLACGGLENPRLLLVSNQVRPAGIGNERDLVGRFFMDHVRIESGVLVPATGVSFHAYSDIFAEPVDRSACLYLRPEAQREERTTVVRMKFQSRRAGETSLGFRGLKSMIDDLASGRPLQALGTPLARMIVDLDGMATGAYGWAVGERELACVSVVEQAPNPDSRVMLSDEIDALGMRRIKLDWRLSALEKESLPRAQKTIATELAAAGLGRMRLARPGEEDSWPGIAYGTNSSPATAFEVGHHHTGTTRMADDPSAGVVDRHCRVFGVANLHLAGSSIFPTLGSANPTLTIVAFALRLADRLLAPAG